MLRPEPRSANMASQQMAVLGATRRGGDALGLLDSEVASLEDSMDIPIVYTLVT